VKVASTARLELREGDDSDAAFIVELLNDPDGWAFSASASSGWGRTSRNSASTNEGDHRR
jgi:hypothetical protein